MKPVNAINAVRNSFEPLSETIVNEVKPFGDDFMEQLLGSKGREMFPKKSGTLGKSELDRARKDKQIEELQAEDAQKSQKLIEAIKVEYSDSQRNQVRENQMLHEEIEQLSVEVVGLAREAGVDTKMHLQNNPRKEKVSTLTVKLLRSIIRALRLKAREAKSGSELVSERKGAKTSGMLAWVSGKQMKIHEQGTMQLQG